MVAWRLGPDGPLLPALSPATTTAVAFDIVALQPLTLTGLAGTKSGTAVLSVRTGSAFATGALASSTGWTTPLTTLTLSAGGVAGLLVKMTSGTQAAARRAAANKSRRYHIEQDKVVFSIIVGTLTTSIVAFSFYLFVRETARQILNALKSADVTEEAEDELAELEEQLEAAEHQDPAQRDSVASDGSALVPWDGGNGNGTHSDSELPPDDGSMPPQHDLASA